MRKFIWPLIVLVLLITLLSWQYIIKKDVNNGVKEQKELSESFGTLTYEIIPGLNNTWGYDILSDNKVIIHQPCIPAVTGNEGFKTKEGAEKVAKLVIEKMKKGEMPPSIDAEEMKKLKAI